MNMHMRMYAYGPTRRAAAVPTPTFHAGTEVFSGAMNSGVMYLNATTLGRELPAMLGYAVERRFRFLALDQTWLAEWFAPDLPAHKARRASSPGWQAGRRRVLPPSPRTPTLYLCRRSPRSPGVHLAPFAICVARALGEAGSSARHASSISTSTLRTDHAGAGRRRVQRARLRPPRAAQGRPPPRGPRRRATAHLALARVQASGRGVLAGGDAARQLAGPRVARHQGAVPPRALPVEAGPRKRLPLLWAD